MKFTLIALAAVATAVSAQELPKCNTINLLKAVGGVKGTSCANASKYSATSGEFPTDEQFKVLCFNDDCAAYRAELKAAEPKECMIKGVFAVDTPLYGKLITPIEEECIKRRETPAPTTAGPEPTTKPVPDQGKPTVTPAPPAAC